LLGIEHGLVHVDVDHLGAAHDLLVGRDWEGVDLDELVRAQLAHVLPEVQGRLAIIGPVVTLSPEAAQYLALAVHELATNAAKYGVLGKAEGTLRIGWRTRRTKGALRLELTWTETGRPLTPPEHSGFGRLLLEQLVPRALAGKSSLEFGDAGLVWRIEFEF
jgi:two-component sensor histidine kinase